MAYTFDGTNKIISLTTGTTSFSSADIYSRWKDWVLTSDNSKYQIAFTVIGGESISATNQAPSFFFLMNGWRIRPQEANHVLTVSGNLIVDGGLDDPYVSTLGSYNVLVSQNTSLAPKVVTGSGVSASDVSDIADAVWDEVLSNHTATGSAGEILETAKDQAHIAANNTQI